MMNKQNIFSVGILFLLVLPSCLAVTPLNETSLGEISLPWLDHSILIEEAIVFVAVFIIFLAIVYEMVNVLGFIEQFWMKAVISFIVVLLINIKGFIYRAVFFLKDIQNLVTWLTSLTLGKIVFILAIVALVVFLMILLRSLVSQWKKDAKKEEKELEAIREEGRKKLRKIRDGF